MAQALLLSEQGPVCSERPPQDDAGRGPAAAVRVGSSLAAQSHESSEHHEQGLRAGRQSALQGCIHLCAVYSVVPGQACLACWSKHSRFLPVP